MARQEKTKSRKQLEVDVSLLSRDINRLTLLVSLHRQLLQFLCNHASISDFDLSEPLRPSKEGEMVPVWSSPVVFPTPSLEDLFVKELTMRTFE